MCCEIEILNVILVGVFVCEVNIVFGIYGVFYLMFYDLVLILFVSRGSEVGIGFCVMFFGGGGCFIMLVLLESFVEWFGLKIGDVVMVIDGEFVIFDVEDFFLFLWGSRLLLLVVSFCKVIWWWGGEE